MQITLNKEKFTVNDNEFPIYNHAEYTTLILRPQLSIFEREIALIKELSSVFDLKIFINYGINHGGYLPIKLIKTFEKIYVQPEKQSDTYNLNKNKEVYDKLNKIRLIEDYVHHNDYTRIIKLESNAILPDYFKNNLKNIIILSYRQLNLVNYQSYKLENSNLLIYIPNVYNKKFLKKFAYCLYKNLLTYDNLINLCIMVKNAGNGFKKILEDNLPYIDEWTILDTGSTDNTVQIINDVLKNKKGNLYEEPFINFRDSRNRLLDLAGKKCKYNIMLDDTYVLTGPVRNFLNTIRSDEFADSYNIRIKSDDIIYGTNRITKSDRNLRYIYKIHEIIQKDDNIVIQVPIDQILIDDRDNEYMKKRTAKRKENDLKLLFEEIEENPDDPRHFYYAAQTYTELNKWQEAYNYFRKRIEHPNKEGYREEITDSYFNCAHIAETKLNWEWNKCEQLYLDCFNHESGRSDSLFCIGYHYFKENNQSEAFKYFKKGFALGYPIDLHMSLRPNIYNKYLPKFLSELCYGFKEYQLGKEAIERYLTYNPPDETSISLYKIFNLLIQSQNNLIEKLILNNTKPIICFLADGGYKPWSGSSINKEGVGGSETYIIEMSRKMGKILNQEFEIYVFCKCEKEEIFDGVIYKNINDYIPFLNQNYVKVSIISRFSEFIPVTIENQVENIYLVVHDLTPTCNIIPMHKSLKGIFCMTPWHKQHFLKSFPMLKHITFVHANGINIDKYATNIISKRKHSFIYSSFPNRGLINLLKMFPRIKQILPDATLNIFCNTKNDYVQSIAKNEMDEIDKLLEEQKDYVTNHGWVKKEVLRNYWLKSEIWLYPCTFQETFCITALEAAASQTLAITTDLAALNDTVADRGIMISGDPRGQEWQDKAIEKLIYILNSNNIEDKLNLLEKNKKWSEEYDWIKLAEKMVETIHHEIKLQLDIIAEETELPLDITTKETELDPGLEYILDSRLEYMGMLNWSNDIPTGSKKIFENILDRFKNTEANILEVGTYTGTSIIAMLEYLPETYATTIDTWENYEESELLKSIEENKVEDIFYQNLKKVKMIERVMPYKGDSKDILLDLIIKNEKYDFIYIDGSHKCLDCYTDMILSWELLKSGGILGLDDYLWNPRNLKNDVLDRPYYAIQYFLIKYHNKFELLHQGYRMFLLKK